ncbi:MAG: FtsB family cell division protein [Candidatus Kapaibacteriota bacterium]|jgi:cell division protein FtsL
MSISQQHKTQAPKEAQSVSKARKFLNRISLLAILILGAGGTAVYIKNVMRVNKMLNEVRALEKTRDSLISVNQQLKSKVLDMQSAPRITELAKQRLGMIPNPKAPTSVTP